MSDVTIVDLVQNGTMNAEMAAVLWAAVDEQQSFLTVALPRLAGKSTTSYAALALRRPEVALTEVAGEARLMEQLKQERRGGYLLVAEFSRAPMYGYIWGDAVQRVFDTLPYGYALQTSLHADSVDEGMQVVTREIGISDEQASAFKLVLYIRRFGDAASGYWRRLAEIFEVDRIEQGRPVGRTLFRWRQDDDSFEKVAEPRQIATQLDLSGRASVIQELADNGWRSPTDVADAIAQYHR
jgi:hypothetical protein